MKSEVVQFKNTNLIKGAYIKLRIMDCQSFSFSSFSTFKVHCEEKNVHIHDLKLGLWKVEPCFHEKYTFVNEFKHWSCKLHLQSQIYGETRLCYYIIQPQTRKHKGLFDKENKVTTDNDLFELELETSSFQRISFTTTMRYLRN